VVKIGDQYITKEWDCGEEFRETLERSGSATKNRYSSTAKNEKIKEEMNDTFDPSRATVSRRLFEENEENSVEPNPTIERKSFTKHNFKTKVDH